MPLQAAEHLASSRIAPASGTWERPPQGGAVVSVALVHARDQRRGCRGGKSRSMSQPLRSSCRKAQRQPVGDGVDVGEACEVADERGEPRIPVRAGASKRAHRVRPRTSKALPWRARACRGGAGRNRPAQARRSPAAPARGGRCSRLRVRSSRRSPGRSVSQPPRHSSARRREAPAPRRRIAVAEVRPRSNVSRSASSTVSRTASGWSRSAWHRLRRAHHMAAVPASQGSEASSVA